jgi:hypothetical protein
MSNFTNEDLQLLEQAIARGVKKVKYGPNNEVEYNDLSDMLKARDIMRKSLGVTKRGGHMNPSYSKGLSGG